MLIEMYKADRQAGMSAGNNDVAPLPFTTPSSLQRLPRSLRPDADNVVSENTTQPTVTQSLRSTRPSRPMLRNLSDLGPRVTCRSTPLWPPVSVLVTSSVSPTDEYTASVNVERSPTASSSSSRNHPSTICESNDEVDYQLHDDDDDDNGDVIKLLPLPVTDDNDSRANHVAPQQLIDHVSSSSNMIRRTVSPSDNSQSVIAL